MKSGVSQIRKLKKEFNEANQELKKELVSTRKVVGEISEKSNKTLNDLKNINIIISDIDKNFSEKTSILNKKDMFFLWGATALQCGKWILLPAFDERSLTPNKEDRKDAAIEGRKDKTKTGKQLNEEGLNQIERGQFINCEQIMALPVPYDAMKGTESIIIEGVTTKGKNLWGGNHHSATWGHDPIMGHIIGTANILTRSITFRDGKFTTKTVEIPIGREQVVTEYPYNFVKMFFDVKDTIREDRKRQATAHMKQVLHMQSDKYTKDGLPIPLLSAKRQQRLLKQGWNSKELENIFKGAVPRVSLQLFISAFLNSTVGILHGFCYDENRDENINVYAARTRKLIATSNILASSINISAVAAGSVSGILLENPALVKKSISHVDVGGYIEALHQIAKNRKLQESIRREFLEMELYDRFLGEQYSFLEETYYE